MNPDCLDNRRILLVDDDEIFTEILKEFFSLKTVFIDNVGDLHQARQLLAHTSFDLILLDNYLPDGFGVELMFFLHEQNIDVPVIMITADDDQDTMHKCFENGVNDYVLKPINLELMWLKMSRCFRAYVVKQQLDNQNKQLERLIDEKQHEEDLARHVYRHFTSSSNELSKGVRTYLQPSGAFNGDFFIDGHSPNGNYIMILVDGTGHGLAAALCVMPVLSITRAMIKKGFSLEHIIHEINSKLYVEIPDDRFVACIAIELDFQRQQLCLFNCGMPGVLVLDDNCQIKAELKSDCLPLGILCRREFSPNMHRQPLVVGEHLLFYSDGLTEQPSYEGQVFGLSEFQQVFAQCQSAELIVDNILAAFNQHASHAIIQDDVSLCYVNLGLLCQAQLDKYPNDSEEQTEKMTQVNFSLDICGSLIAKTNIVSLLEGVIQNLGVGVRLRQKSFTIFAELVNNGLDHGILKLDSELKNDLEGFADYLEERETRLLTLSSEDKLTLTLCYQQPSNILAFSVEDSGGGYEPKQDISTIPAALSGRGVNLVKKLSEQFIVHEPGNKTSVTIK